MTDTSSPAKGTPGNWQRILAEVTALAEIPHMTVSRLLRILDAALLYESHLAKNPLNAALAQRGDLRQYQNAGPIFRAVTIKNVYSLLPTHVRNELVVPSVADLITPETDAVVELGCGFGRHLFALRDLLEHKFPKLKYFGGELSPDGLDAAKRISALEKDRAPIGFHVFDHLDPSLAFLGDCRNVIFFTAHSLEQVKNIQLKWFEEILRIGGSVRCFHAEPVGWQFNDEVMQNLHVLQGQNKRLVRLYGPVDDYYSAVTPFMSGWNRNLAAVLKELEAAGRIKIDYVEPNAAGDEIYNPSTHILWTKL